MGGTFDPIHTGHLILAEAAYESFSLDYVLIMPNGNPPHKAGQVNATMADSAPGWRSLRWRTIPILRYLISRRRRRIIIIPMKPWSF